VADTFQVGPPTNQVTLNKVWNPSTLAWEAMSQPVISTDTLAVDVTFPSTYPVTDNAGSLTVDGTSLVTQVQGYNGSNWQNARMDSSTRTFQIIDYAHHEIHAGSHFMYTDAVELASAATQDYLITTPDTTKWAHILFDMDGSAITQWQLYEGSDKDGTTLQTVGNSNRNSLTAATTTIHKGTSGGTTDGVLMHVYKGGSASAQSKGPATSRNDEEIILKQDTKYILRVTSGTNANLTNLRIEFYEHTNQEA